MKKPFAPIDAWIFRLDDLDLPPLTIDLERASKIADADRRRFHALGRSLLRKVLALLLNRSPEEIIFQIAPGGKPHVRGCEFSISHSGCWLAVATGDRPIGVDVESQSPRRDPLELAHRFFSEPDAARLRAVSDTARRRVFLQQWVAKEAALKAAGVGLSQHLAEAECVFENETVREVRWGSSPSTVFAIEEFALPDGTPGAVAGERGSGKIRWRNPVEIGVS